MSGFIYVVFVNNLYKVGRCADFPSRLKDYPKGTDMLHVAHVDNMVQAEKTLIKSCNDSDKLTLTYGREYFTGDYQELYKCFTQVVLASLPSRYVGAHRGPIVNVMPRHVSISKATAVVTDSKKQQDRREKRLTKLLLDHGLDSRLYKVSKDVKGHRLLFSVYEGSHWVEISRCRSFPDLQCFLTKH